MASAFTSGGSSSSGGGKGGSGETSSGGFSWDTGKANGFDPKESGKQLAGDIMHNYAQGPQVFDKSLYAGMGEGTQNTIQGMLEQAQRPTPQFGKAMDFASGAIDQAGQPGLAAQNLTEMASGGMIGQSNPYREQILDDTRADVEASLGASGRFGTNAHVETLADRLGGLRGSFYDQDRAQQMGAINMINNEQGQQFGQGMSASAALPTLYNNQFAPGQMGLGLNQMLDQDKQGQLMAEYDLFERQKPGNHIQENIGLLQMLQGNPGMEPEKKTGFGDIIGGAIGLGSMFL